MSASSESFKIVGGRLVPIEPNRGR